MADDFDSVAAEGDDGLLIPVVIAEPLLLPLPDPDAPTLIPVAEPPPIATILCVDDEPNILRSLTRLFKAQRYKVLIAEGGEQGLKTLAQEPVDVVLSDMRMPGMDGAQFLSRVADRYPEIPRLLLTGYADLTATVGAINDGQITRYVSKPWAEEDLTGAISEALAAQTLKRENAGLEAQIREQNKDLERINRDLEKLVEQRIAEIKKTNERLKTNYVASIKVFSNLIDLRGGNLSGHSRRVAELAVKMGTEMKLPKPVLQEILLGSLLHDVGKIGFPDSLNGKPLGQMNIDETRIYKSHPNEGQTALEALGEMGNVAIIVRHHHEMWDGSGYPDALSGDRIPITARIVCLANDYDGLISGTLVAAKLRPEQALKMIQLGSGTRYDPACVRAFEQVLFKDVAGEHERLILATECQVGMVLTRDLYSSDGTLLGVANTQFAEVAVQRLHAFQNPDNSPLKLWIRKTQEEILAARRAAVAPPSS